uniref:Uncharacterized protein n=1 Tax=Triticum urartu TaxID=4572 RepID=A0A8R7PK45_TRIUA
MHKQASKQEREMELEEEEEGEKKACLFALSLELEVVLDEPADLLLELLRVGSLPGPGPQRRLPVLHRPDALVAVVAADARLLVLPAGADAEGEGGQAGGRSGGAGDGGEGAEAAQAQLRAAGLLPRHPYLRP